MGPEIMQAVVRPMVRGMHASFGKGGSSDTLISKVLAAVPIERVKSAVKESLYPQYEAACRSVAPSMEVYGGFAGVKIVEYLKVHPHALQGCSPLLQLRA
jgi:hypothetical protein